MMTTLPFPLFLSRGKRERNRKKKRESCPIVPSFISSKVSSLYLPMAVADMSGRLRKTLSLAQNSFKIEYISKKIGCIRAIFLIPQEKVEAQK